MLTFLFGCGAIPFGTFKVKASWTFAWLRLNRDHIPVNFLEIFNGRKKGSTFADPSAIKLSLLKSN